MDKSLQVTGYGVLSSINAVSNLTSFFSTLFGTWKFWNWFCSVLTSGSVLALVLVLLGCSEFDLN